MSGTSEGTIVGGVVGARAGGFNVGCTGQESPAGGAFLFSMSCIIKFEIVLHNSFVAVLFALLIAVCCAIKSRNIVVVSLDATRGVGSWLFNAVFSARRSSIFFVIFSISSYKAVRRSSVDTAGAAAIACRASRSPRTVESSTVNGSPFAESCWNCSYAYCIAAEVTEGDGSDALCNLGSAVVIAILTTFTDRVAFLKTLEQEVNPRSKYWALCKKSLMKKIERLVHVFTSYQ